jgi:hypothetical protein
MKDALTDKQFYTRPHCLLRQVLIKAWPVDYDSRYRWRVIRKLIA